MKLMKAARVAPFFGPSFEFNGFPNRLRQLLDESLSVDSLESGVTPPVEIHETASDFIVTAELPGVRKEDVELDYENGMLFIRGEKQSEGEKKDQDLLVWERTYGAFQRVFMLPKKVDPDHITAQFKDGVLTVTLPKVEIAKGKKIPIGEDVK